MLTVRTIDLGRMPYRDCWEYQRRLFDALTARRGEASGEAGWILTVEHPPVYTLGKSGKAQNLLVGEEFLRAKGAEYYPIDRGGDITFHGPGQVVCYPILDLGRLGIGLREYVGRLEAAVIEVVGRYGIRGSRIAGASGVWIADEGTAPRKICAIGVRASRFITMHGFALNVATDLEWFRYINPCGFADRGVTSIARETGRTADMNEVKQLTVTILSEKLNVEIYNR
ncbi:lipoyl(octanoyl) transferase LipB [Alistipes sp.]|uniref:lipoyl(octanoyl) transferase LipB n=1 Tax=Alistipes sp. TaxID=1872444 RepID=UPI003A8C0392